MFRKFPENRGSRAASAALGLMYAAIVIVVAMGMFDALATLA